MPVQGSVRALGSSKHRTQWWKFRKHKGSNQDFVKAKQTPLGIRFLSAVADDNYLNQSSRSRFILTENAKIPVWKTLEVQHLKALWWTWNIMELIWFCNSNNTKSRNSHCSVYLAGHPSFSGWSFLQRRGQWLQATECFGNTLLVGWAA